MGCFENLQRPKTVYLKVELRVVDRVLVGEVSGEVVYDIWSRLERATQVLIPSNVALQEVNLGAAGDVPLVGRREVVENGNPLYIEGCKGVYQVCADRA